MQSKIIVFLFFIFSHTLFSQNKEKVDSLLREFKTTADFKIALSKADMALQISRSINYKEGIIKSNISKIRLYFDHFDNSECFKIIDEVEPEILNLKNPVFISQLSSFKAQLYIRLNLKDSAKQELDKALLFANNITDNNSRHYEKGKVYLVFATLYDCETVKDQYAVVLKYLKMSYRELCLVKSGFHNEALVITCNALGSYYSHTNDFKSAKFYFNKAIAISRTLHCEKCGAYAFNRIAKMFYNMNDYDNAILNYEKSLKISKISENVGMIQENYMDLTLAYEKVKDDKKQKEALKQLKNIRDSIEYINKLSFETAVKGITDDIKLENSSNTDQFKRYIILGSILCLFLFYIILMYLKKYKSEKENRAKLEGFLNEKLLLIQSLNSNKDSNKDTIEKEEELKKVVHMAMTNDLLFFESFNELFPDFKVKLLKIDPFFRVNDLKLCYYLKLNFDTKEIARYTGDTVRSVESKKYRLRKKINISSKEDINAWFNNL
jgi:tetratricopeptide (TPR) repeat protein